MYLLLVKFLPLDFLGLLYLRNYGCRTFSVALPQLCNALPLEIRSCNGIPEFKRKLKTHLFKKAFS